MIANTIFPCQENPIWCYLHSPGNDCRLGSRPDGSVFTTENRQGWEEWEIHPVEHSGDKASFRYCHIKSRKHDGRFLSSDKNGKVMAQVIGEVGDSEIWQVETSCHYEGGLLVMSKAHQRQLTCDSIEVTTVSGPRGGCETWIMEFMTGELCFIQSSSNLFLSCDRFCKTSLKHNSDVCESWRFIEVGDREGSVVISSWNHTTKCLASNGVGHVYITDNPRGEWERWILEKPSDSEGVMVRSLSHGKMLTWYEGNELATYAETSSRSIWKMKPINDSTFYISLLNEDLRLACSSAMKPVTTSDRHNSSAWKIEADAFDGSMFFQNMETKCWLAVDENERLCLSDTRDSNMTTWKVEGAIEGEVFLVSLSCNKKLGFVNDELKIFDGDIPEFQKWYLEPVLPTTACNKINYVLGRRMKNRPISAWRSW